VKIAATKRSGSNKVPLGRTVWWLAGGWWVPALVSGGCGDDDFTMGF